MQTENSIDPDQLVQGLAHRMNNILTLFHGYIGLLMDNKKLDTESQEGLSRIRHSARAATELIDRTHLLVEPSRGHRRNVDFRELVLSLNPTFEAIRRPRTKLIIDIPDDLSPVRAEPVRLRTVIVELVTNALDAAAPGGRVELTAGIVETSGEAHDGHAASSFEIRVSDNGAGIPEGNAKRIFQPFFTTKKKQNSAGLGLSIARTFAAQHKGTLTFTSVPGETVFTLRLPVHAEK